MNPPIMQQNLSTDIHPKRRRWILTFVCWAYMAIAIAAWLMLQWADEWWPATLLMFSPRWIFALPLIPLLPITWLVRSRLMVVVLAAGLIVAWPVMGFNVPWPLLTSSTPSDATIRVMTLNMHYSKTDPKALEDLIAKSSTDIIAVQEWGGYEETALRSDPAWHIHATPRLFLASRYPIKNTVELGKNSMSEHASLAHYELNTPIGTVHVFSIHTATTREGIHDIIHENRSGPAELRENSSLRREQSAFAASKAAECHGPVLIMGDFNTTSASVIFSEVWGGYTDAFTAAGWGCGYTFIGSKTAVRIDHILIGEGWTCTSCRAGPYVGSPHRPVIAELIWTGDAKQH